MQDKKTSHILLLSAVLMFAGGAAQADNSEDTGKQQGSEASESFMQRWFGWGKRPAERQNVEKVRATKSEREHTKADKGKNRPDSTFSQSERSSIVDYYRDENRRRGGGDSNEHKKKKLPPGLQKKLERGGELPPGWQTKVNRGEVLDAELLRHAQPLPGDLRNRLPMLQDGTEMRRIGDKIVRIMEGNGTVLDVIDLADTTLRR